MNEKITVLIADDNPEFAMTLASYLRKENDMDIVGMVKDGEEAYELIKELKPDVVLLDIIMPHLDGLGVLEKLNKSTYMIPYALKKSNRQNANMYYFICSWTR